MNIQPVTLREGQTIQCAICLCMKSPIWADLDGPAFKAYYCHACKLDNFTTNENGPNGGRVK